MQSKMRAVLEKDWKDVMRLIMKDFLSHAKEFVFYP